MKKIEAYRAQAVNADRTNPDPRISIIDGGVTLVSMFYVIMLQSMAKVKITVCSSLDSLLTDVSFGKLTQSYLSDQISSIGSTYYGCP